MATSAERVVILSSLREAKDFPTEKALRKYLKDHPEADPKRHTVNEGPGSKKPVEDGEPKKKGPPPIPEDAKKKKNPPPVPEEAKKKPAPEKGKDSPSKEKQEKPEKQNRLEAWKGKFKNLSDKAKKIVEDSPKAVKHFLADEEFRTKALTEASSMAKKAPKKLLNSLVETAKHEVHEFKSAGKGIAAAMSGKKVSKKQKHAIKAVATHMAIAGAAAAFAASGPLAGAGLFGKALVKHTALKAVHKSLGQLHTLEEVGHIGHGVLHLMKHFATDQGEEGGEEPNPEQALAMLVMAAVASEIEKLEDDDFSQALEGGEGAEEENDSSDEEEDTEMSEKQASIVVARFLEAARQESMGTWEGEEHFWPTMSHWTDLPEKRDRFNDVYVMSYEYEGHDISGFLSVTFDGTDFANSGGKRPGKWKTSSYLGGTDKGTWKKIDDIPKILKQVVAWAQKQSKEASKKLEGLGGSAWRGEISAGMLTYEYHKSNQGDGNYMSATIMDIDEFLEEGTAELEVSFSEGYDYEGTFGDQEAIIRVSGGFSGLKSALQKAAKLWSNWTSK